MISSDLAPLAQQLDLDAGTISGGILTRRHLGDLKGCYADTRAFDAMLAAGDALHYTVSSIEVAHGKGDLHYGLGMLMPGRIGREYFLTKGHYHAWREAAEVYLGLRGEGFMLLEHELTGETHLLPLGPNRIVYIAPCMAHRTINTGREPLVYLGVFPAMAGHDYGAVATRNFRHVVVEESGRPVMIERKEFRP